LEWKRRKGQIAFDARLRKRKELFSVMLQLLSGYTQSKVVQEKKLQLELVQFLLGKPADLFKKRLCLNNIHW
jgi:hypothetical protein